MDTECAHCRLLRVGYGVVDNQSVCHPDRPGLDCYHLVTVHRHDMPCYQAECRASVLARVARESAGIGPIPYWGTE